MLRESIGVDESRAAMPPWRCHRRLCGVGPASESMKWRIHTPRLIRMLFFYLQHCSSQSVRSEIKTCLTFLIPNNWKKRFSLQIKLSHPTPLTVNNISQEILSTLNFRFLSFPSIFFFAISSLAWNSSTTKFIWLLMQELYMYITFHVFSFSRNFFNQKLLVLFSNNNCLKKYSTVTNKLDKISKY